MDNANLLRKVTNTTFYSCRMIGDVKFQTAINELIAEGALVKEEGWYI